MHEEAYQAAYIQAVKDLKALDTTIALDMEKRRRQVELIRALTRVVGEEVDVTLPEHVLRVAKRICCECHRKNLLDRFNCIGCTHLFCDKCDIGGA